MNDQSFSNLIADAVAAKMTPDFIEAQVNSRVEKLIVESIDQALRSYSDTGKQICKAVENALRVDALDLPSYGAVVSGMLKVQIEAICADLVAGKLKEDMEELLHLAPKEMKLSKIAKYMIESGLHFNEWGKVITVEVEHSDHGYAMVYLDDWQHHERDARRHAKHSLHLNKEGKIIGATIDQRPTTDAQKIGGHYGLGQMIRAWVACGTTIILDEDEVCLSKDEDY